jgi:hypothetical protein
MTGDLDLEVDVKLMGLDLGNMIFFTGIETIPVA